MPTASTEYLPAASMHGRVGTVVPVWFPSDTEPALAQRLLRTTLTGTPAVLAPGDVLLVIDGCAVAAEAAAALRAEAEEEWGMPFGVLELPENRGKGGALVAGIRTLLAERGESLRWIATRDADGDHLTDDLPHLFRIGEQIVEECGASTVCVIGRRANLQAPLGWARAEYELLLNEVLIEAVSYARARAGSVWDTRYLVERVPDLQSGYKLFSLAAAARAADALEQEAAAAPDLGLLRTGMEIVPFVRLAMEGAIFGETTRKAFYDQPVTSYGRVELFRFYGSKLAWALRTCELPARGAALLLDAAIGRRPLYCDPAGRESLLTFRRFVLERLPGGPNLLSSSEPPRVPRFL